MTAAFRQRRREVARLIPGVRLIVLGAAGGGQGHAMRAACRATTSCPHISTGDILRAAVKEGTELGLKAKEIMDEGGLVPDDIMIGIVAERIGQARRPHPGLHPRRLPPHGAPGRGRSTRSWPSSPSTWSSTSTCPRELVLQRLAARRVCQDCGTNYTATGLERSALDLRGVRRRRDPADGRHRGRHQPPPRPLRDPDPPLIEYYGTRGLLVRVDGVGAPDEVLLRLVTEIERTAGVAACPVDVQVGDLALPTRGGSIASRLFPAPGPVTSCSSRVRAEGRCRRVTASTRDSARVEQGVQDDSRNPGHDRVDAAPPSHRSSRRSHHVPSPSGQPAARAAQSTLLSTETVSVR